MIQGAVQLLAIQDVFPCGEGSCQGGEWPVLPCAGGAWITQVTVAQVSLHVLLPYGSEERGVLGLGSIPVAIFPSSQDMKSIALY